MIDMYTNSDYPDSLSIYSYGATVGDNTNAALEALVADGARLSFAHHGGSATSVLIGPRR